MKKQLLRHSDFAIHFSKIHPSHLYGFPDNPQAPAAVFLQTAALPMWNAQIGRASCRERV